MAQCVVIDTGGAVVSSSADPCTGLLLLTPAEYGAMVQNPFVLTPADGATLGFAVAAVWAVAWGFRVLGDYVQSRDAVDQ